MRIFAYFLPILLFTYTVINGVEPGEQLSIWEEAPMRGQHLPTVWTVDHKGSRQPELDLRTYMAIRAELLRRDKKSNRTQRKTGPASEPVPRRNATDNRKYPLTPPLRQQTGSDGGSHTSSASEGELQNNTISELKAQIASLSAQLKLVRTAHEANETNVHSWSRYSKREELVDQQEALKAQREKLIANLEATSSDSTETSGSSSPQTNVHGDPRDWIRPKPSNGELEDLQFELDGIE